MKSWLIRLLHGIGGTNAALFAVYAATAIATAAGTEEYIPSTRDLEQATISAPIRPTVPDPAVPRRSLGQTPAGLADSDWNTIRAAYESARHAVRASEEEPGVWLATNPGQRWHVRFEESGFLARPGGSDKPDRAWTWGLSLSRYGWDGDEKPLPSRPRMGTHEHYVSYCWTPGISEWFSNDRSGLEHGLTINERPPGSPASDNLAFTFSIRGNLTPVPSPDGLGVHFKDAPGRNVLTYDGLKVWDADHKPLTSRFFVAHDGGTPVLRLIVDAAGARYPVTVDPTAREAYLKASDADELAWFGWSVAIAGNTVVVGAPGEDSGSAVNEYLDNMDGAGAAYVFVRDGSTWVQQAYLKASSPELDAEFGKAVSLDGDTVVVGAPKEGATDKGAAYVFVRTGSAWSQPTRLQPAAINGLDNFGQSVAVSGDTLVIGVPEEDSIASESGAAYVFLRSGAAWNQQAYLKASGAAINDRFGKSVEISGNTIAVGAPDESGSSPGSGAVYLFTRSGSLWSQQAYVKASNPGESDFFGTSVALEGDTLAIGAPGESSNATGTHAGQVAELNNDSYQSGAVYVFTRSGANWPQQAYIKASNTGTDDRFGSAVALSGDTLVVGAPYEDSLGSGINSGVGAEANDGSENSGAVYVFVRSAGEWAQQAYIKMTKLSSAYHYFGWSVAVSEETMIAGAPGDPSEAVGVNPLPEYEQNMDGELIGSVSVYSRYGSTWQTGQGLYLKASNSEASDDFGASVAVSGNTVAIGAPGEDGSGVGPHATIINNNAPGSGAVYVFVRSGDTWIEQAYIKASNTDAGDGFGTSLGLSGDTLVVGAPNEDSNSTIVNGSEGNSPSSYSNGAAYVFVRNGSTWDQQAYLKPATSAYETKFGSKAVLDGDTIAIGCGPYAGVKVYAFRRSGVTWTREAALTPTPSATEFGSAIAASGDRIVVGAEGATSWSGAGYVFRRVNGVWQQEAIVGASNAGSYDHFGCAVGISGGVMIIGAWGEASNATGINPGAAAEANNYGYNSGAAYIFRYSSEHSVWEQEAYVKASQASSMFGRRVAISENTAVVGEGTTGTVSVFVRSGSTWAQRARITGGSNTEAGDQFGVSFAVDRGTIVFGANGEDSNATTVNPGATAEANNSALNAGAAYIFFEYAPFWTQ